MKIALPEQRKLVHDMVLSIRWGDMDAMGHVNNTVYFRYMETVRIEWMRAVGCDPDPQGQGPVIVNAFCNFYRQLEYPGDVRVKMYVSDPGRTTFETWCTMERTDQPGVVCAEGGATTIWVDFPQQKAETLPDLLETWLSWWRDVLLLANGAAAAAITNVDLTQELTALARRWTPDGARAHLHDTQTALWQLDHNANTLLVLENLFLRYPSSSEG